LATEISTGNAFVAENIPRSAFHDAFGTPFAHAFMNEFVRKENQRRISVREQGSWLFKDGSFLTQRFSWRCEWLMGSPSSETGSEARSVP
jgi:hypothetical protein